MSAHKPDWTWLRFLRVAAVAAVAAVVAVVGSVAMAAPAVSARGVSDRLAPHATVAEVGASAHSAAGKSAAKILGGFTSQGWPVVVELSSDGKTIARVGVGLAMRCTSGILFAEGDGWVHLPISTTGMVHAAAALSPLTGSSGSLTGGSDLFTGRLNHQRSAFTGAWQLRLMFKDTTGHTDRCDSGRVSFTASR
jgi:hypothetical protein